MTAAKTAPRKPAAKTTVPAGAKKPADRQTAKDDVVSEERVFNWRGTDYTVDTERIDDLEFIEKLEQNMLATALGLMLGKDQYETYKAQVKESEGRVSMKTTQTFLEEYMEFAGRGN